MGQCTQGDIQIELQTVEDADYVYDQLENIEELTEVRTKASAYIDLHDTQVDGTVYSCNVYSDRLQNGEFHIEQVIEQLKVMVKEGKIKPPYSLTGELLVQHQGWSLAESDFGEDLTDT